MTNGGDAVTSGGWRASPRGRMIVAWLIIAGFGAAHVVVNAATVLDEFERAGRAVERWEPWLWEASSTLTWLSILPLVFLAARRLQPPHFAVPVAVGAHLLLTLPASLAHVAGMNALRFGFYAAIGRTYLPGPLGEVLIYEYRKDLITYLLLVGFFLLFDRVTRPQAAHAPTARDHRIEIRDGSRIRWIEPDEIEWVEAAGNYAELHGRFGTLLHRTTLASLEEELAPHGLVRVHRSRIVRRSAVAAVETRSSGDFELLLESGARIGGSRRFRDNL